MKNVVIRSICVVFSVIIAFSFLGCGGKFGKKEGELVVWWPGSSDVEIAALYKAKEYYEKENPDVTVRIIEKMATNFYDAYILALNGADYPDICYVDHVYVQQMAHSGDIANLSNADAEIETTIKSKVIDSLWSVNQYENKTYGLPVSANVTALVYNKAVLRAAYAHAGKTWTTADVPTTWDELMAACAIVKAYSDTLPLNDQIVAYTFPSGSGANSKSMSALQFMSYVAREGGTLMSSDLKTINLESAQVKSAANKVYSLGAGGYGYSSAVFEEGKFEGGRVAFIEMGPWKINTYKLLTESNPETTDFGWAPLVKFSDNGPNTSALGLYSMVATKKSINLKLAIDFMKYFLSDEELMLLQNVNQNVISPLKSTRDNEAYTQGDIWPIYMSQIDNVVARPGTPIWAEYENNLGEFMTGLLNNTQKSVANGLADLNYKLQNALDEALGGGW